jgi:hypothetical protein
MSQTVKSIAIVATVLLGAASMAMAQAPGSVRRNHMASGGPGTHSTQLKTGSASNTQKLMKNQNGYRSH